MLHLLPPKGEEVLGQQWLRKDLMSFITLSEIWVESYDAQSRPSFGGVAVETLPLSGLGAFVAVKAYY